MLIPFSCFPFFPQFASFPQFGLLFPKSAAPVLPHFLLPWKKKEEEEEEEEKEEEEKEEEEEDEEEEENGEKTMQFGNLLQEVIKENEKQYHNITMKRIHLSSVKLWAKSIKKRFTEIRIL